MFDGDKYIKTEEASVENLATVYDKIGTIRKSVVMNFTFLLAKEIKDGSAFPMDVGFKKTSLSAGRKLSTMLMKLSVFNKPSAAKTFLISCTSEENDKGKYFVMDVAQGRDTTKEELEDAKLWYEITNSKKVVYDEKANVL